MKVSARNQFRGHIKAIHSGSVNAEVAVDIGGGDELVAIVTTESVRLLGLAVGGDVVALVKAPWVMLMGSAAGARQSARNCLVGTVINVASGTVNTEVNISLHGGKQVTAVVTREAAIELGLKAGAPVSAIVKASSVILALPG